MISLERDKELLQHKRDSFQVSIRRAEKRELYRQNRWNLLQSNDQNMNSSLNRLKSDRQSIKQLVQEYKTHRLKSDLKLLSELILEKNYESIQIFSELSEQIAEIGLQNIDNLEGIHILYYSCEQPLSHAYLSHRNLIQIIFKKIDLTFDDTSMQKYYIWLLKAYICYLTDNSQILKPLQMLIPVVYYRSQQRELNKHFLVMVSYVSKYECIYLDSQLIFQIVDRSIMINNKLFKAAAYDLCFNFVKTRNCAQVSSFHRNIFEVYRQMTATKSEHHHVRRGIEMLKTAINKVSAPLIEYLFQQDHHNDILNIIEMDSPNRRIRYLEFLETLLQECDRTYIFRILEEDRLFPLLQDLLGGSMETVCKLPALNILKIVLYHAETLTENLCVRKIRDNVALSQILEQLSESVNKQVSELAGHIWHDYILEYQKYK